jgi:pimeloyl-ACP methyl ester carboxylesterase
MVIPVGILENAAGFGKSGLVHMSQALMDVELLSELPRPDGNRIAYGRREGKQPTVIFVGGFRSDMTGSKAIAVTRHAAVRFDPLGHGASTGRFEDGTIGRWKDDLLAVIDELTEGPLLIVGSSMGVWLALLAARERPERLYALIGIAGAPDFTEALVLPALPPDMRDRLYKDGRILLPSAYGEPYAMTRELIEEGRNHLQLDRPIELGCPVRLLHGMKDSDVPYSHGIRLAEALAGPDARLTLIKDGDHRLSRDQDIALLLKTVDELLGY